MDARRELTARLGKELADHVLAHKVVAGLDDHTLEGLVALAGNDIAKSAALSYTPATTVLADGIDTLWLFAFGYRFRPESLQSHVDLFGAVPPIDALIPGPVNEQLARLAAEFVKEHPVPVIAQWEIARVLDDLGVERVISVEPEITADGTVVYLSTAGVATEGLRLAADAGFRVGHAGVLGFSDHAVRCLLTARAVGMTADLPDGVDLPSEYDPESGQVWTRSRDTWIPVDLLGRSLLAQR